MHHALGRVPRPHVTASAAATLALWLGCGPAPETPALEVAPAAMVEPPHPVATEAPAGMATSTPVPLAPGRGPSPPDTPSLAARRPRPLGAASPYAPGVDVLHYDVALDLSRPGEALRATAVLRVALGEPRPDTLRLDLGNVTVAAVRVGLGEGAQAPVRAPHRGGRLHIPLPPAGGADTVTVAIDYGGVPADGLVPGRTLHGAHAVFADNWPDRARHWLPSVDHPSDKATVTFTVATPASWEVVANGEGVPAGERAWHGAPPAAGSRLWAYAMAVPIPTYTMVVGATDFAIHTVDGCAPGGVTPLRPDGCVAVSAWALPPDSGHMAHLFRRAGAMVAFYSDLIGPFPYHKLAHVQSATRFGGMENAGAVFYPEGPIAAGADIERIVAHETAHQWFGDAVTEADWRHLWLSEGFATYFGALFFQHADGEESFRSQLRAAAETYFGSDDVEEPVIDTVRSGTEHLMALLNANQYQKGAWVLHMLRELVGDSAFFAGTRAYYEAHTHGTALTSDFRLRMEVAAGRELGWFFDQWLQRPGYPVLRVASSWDEQGGVARVTVTQVQPGRWPTFRLPLVLAFVTEAGEVRRTVEVTSRSETFSLPLPAPPRRLRVDPDGALLAVVQEP
ncbi:MAG TPA: M1 family aminopeptidase [Longimicrobiales bacterium]|nr:M1 family aminopeptidase [Longimicrobiales bacterium]